MAGALAPVVWLMVLASALFGAAGLLDGIYPGGSSWSFSSYGGLGWTSYAFGVVNLVVAVFIARGSERSLTLRIGLAAVFVVERTTTAFFPVPKSLPSVGVHIATAVIEAVILTATWRVWRLGHAVAPTDLALLTMPQTAKAGVVAGGPVTRPARLPAPERAASPQRAGPLAPPASRRIPLSASRVIAVLAFVLALALIADPLLAGAIPALTPLTLSSSVAYGYASAVLLIGAFAVSGRRLSLWLLAVVAAVVFLDRVLTTFVLGPGTLSLEAVGLRSAALLLAVALAVVCMTALRSKRQTRPASP